MEYGITRRTFIGTSMGLGLGLAMSRAHAAAIPLGGSGERLLCRIDCTQDYPADQYFGQGDVRVAESAAGRYREAEGKPLSRFGYRFRVEHPGRPHFLVLRYPDDKRRFMCVNDGTGYDLTTGIFTGWAQPLSGEMLELREVFWPRWEDASVVFMTWGEGEPAAVSEIEVYELEDLPALPAPEAGDASACRELGIQYEDPCGTGSSEGAMNRAEWIDHVAQYMRYSGQTLLVYPMAWYEGPQFPSAYEPSDGLDGVIAPDRKQYGRWTTHPVDWYAGLLERFEREGLEFQGALTLLRLGSLLKKMNIDLASIQAGADTFNNMTWNDNVQASTNDWTPFYNAVNFNTVKEQLKGHPPAPPSSLVPQFAYGERTGPANHTGPMFNPVHPVVQEAIIRFAGEIGERYGKYPAFTGISVNMFAACMCWFGSIHFGYDDYTVRLFQEETGIPVRVDEKAPDRFSRRYQYLTYVCRQAWVDWRCRKIRELFGKMHAALTKTRPDLRLVVTLWDETTVMNTMGSITAAHQFGARPSMYDFYRDAGIDVALYNDMPGLEIDRGMGNPRDRGGHGSNPAGGVTLPIEAQTMYRDFDFLDQKAIDAYHGQDRPGAFIFNCWVEAWGNHVWFTPEPDDPNLPVIAQMDGQPAEGVLRMNSEYPKDGFWWDSQLRITPPFPGGPHFLEPYAQAVADLDACRITRGGLFLDKAHSEQIQAFARAFRALPRKKFAPVGGSADPVAVRTLAEENQRYFYVVNREYYAIPVTITFSGAPAGLHDLATGEDLAPGEAWTWELGPYELRAFRMAPGVEIAGFQAIPPEKIRQSLEGDAEQTLRALEQARAAGNPAPGAEDLERGIREALVSGRWAWLRRALTSYIARKTLERATKS